MISMDTYSVIAGFIGGIVAGFIGGSITGWFSGWQYSSKIIELDRKINQIWGSFNSGKGVNARAEMDEQVQATLAQAMQIWKGEGDQGEKVNKILGLAAENPKVAMKILKQLGVKL